MKCMLVSRSTAEHIKIFLKKTGIFGMCMDKRKEESKNCRQMYQHTMHGCTCAGHLSRFLSLFFFILPLYCNNIVASLLSYILFMCFQRVNSLLRYSLEQRNVVFYDTEESNVKSNCACSYYDTEERNSLLLIALAPF